ncbi:RNA-binding protein precursor, putative [Ixodes scapularis]|uniref:RNA-binding protein, putative n=1 Tax=Ixodes scapularis TaxID=6945 RepID=B7QFY7_IXOSC|nr:RNA-binding protein precursor, putative [Ixodes scapularis]|eukprot:XP_002401050.1 RNA-binding protein precursor, putative [Ixodes scapularis]
MEGDVGNSQTNLIINYLPQTLTDEEFRSLFTSIGPIKSSKIVRHKATGYSYGFGFVDYQSIEDAARAVGTLNGLQLQNKKIKVAYARPGGETIKHANLYIRGIPKHYPPEQAEKLFADFGRLIQFRVLKDDSGSGNKGYGSVTKVNIIRDTSTGLSKGFGFVTMANYQDCVWAIEALNGFRYAGRPLQVSFKQPK